MDCGSGCKRGACTSSLFLLAIDAVKPRCVCVSRPVHVYSMHVCSCAAWFWLWSRGGREWREGESEERVQRDRRTEREREQWQTRHQYRLSRRSPPPRQASLASRGAQTPTRAAAVKALTALVGGAVALEEVMEVRMVGLRERVQTRSLHLQPFSLGDRCSQT